jgi:hypothetical protein
MADKLRTQDSTSICAEVQPPRADSTQAVPKGVAQERPDLVAHARSNGSGSRKLGPG